MTEIDKTSLLSGLLAGRRHRHRAAVLDEHHYRYHVLGRPTVSDAQYDELLAEATAAHRRAADTQMWAETKVALAVAEAQVAERDAIIAAVRKLAGEYVLMHRDQVVAILDGAA